jgi:hypothetical protein
MSFLYGDENDLSDVLIVVLLFDDDDEFESNLNCLLS